MRNRGSDTEPDKSIEEGPTSVGAFLETLRTVVIAVLIALGVRTFAYEPFNIPSGSMEPTLLIGDYLFVSKLSYGYSRYSIPFSPNLFDGRVFFTEPEVGDVAVFRTPLDVKTDYIKRIVGLPGDRIEVREGVLHINGEPVKRERLLPSELNEIDYPSASGAVYIETLPNGRTHLIHEQLLDRGPLDDWGPKTVLPGHLFAMGDNRDNSQDSRSNVGQIPFENLVGRADVLFFSHDGGSAWWEFWRWPGAIRFGRIGDVIE
ncbi:signal peptidase I [Pelagibius litoralis]|uniref:Signal peptidase I n=2 Tax=Pelagibius litoralis TaxID=374515 RepID=A0A967C1T4_9PROT|nr:signal peptidase I [Pelagibius litoralis]